MFEKVGYALIIWSFAVGVSVFISILLSEKTDKIWAILPATIPAIVVVVVAYFLNSPLYALISVIVFAMVIGGYIYEKFVIDIKIDDLGAIAPGGTLFLLYPIDLGILKSETIMAVYSGVFGAYLTLLGFVLTIAVFIGQTKRFVNSNRIKIMLKGLASFFVLVALVAMVGLLTAPETVDLSREMLFQENEILTAGMLHAALFVLTLSLFLSSISYFLTMFYIIIDKPTKSEEKV